MDRVGFRMGSVSNQIPLLVLVRNQRDWRLNAILLIVQVETNPMQCPCPEESNCDIMILSSHLTLQLLYDCNVTTSSHNCPLIYAELSRVSLSLVYCNNGPISNSDNYTVKMQSEICKA